MYGLSGVFNVMDGPDATLSDPRPRGPQPAAKTIYSQSEL